MSNNTVGLATETRAAADLLATAAERPAALIVEGQAGIGKTTLWLDTIEQARPRRFRVLSARPSQADSALAYGALANLLGAVEDEVYGRLPEPQRRAVDRILLRNNTDGPSDATTDPRAVGAAVASILGNLAQVSPVLLAIDDLQWLDTSSVHAVAFAARRLTGPTAILATVRTGIGAGDSASWLQLPRPEDVRRITLAPMSVGGLHTVITKRLGRSLSRPTMVRIHDISGGNPFYALELARPLDDPTDGTHALPDTLAELVSSRIGGLPTDVREVLLAAACIAAPTVDEVSQAASCDGPTAIELLESAEVRGIVVFEGQRVRFTHPLLARGIYSGASAAKRRAMHRRLAEIVTEPELRARHLALGTTVGDALTLQSLDVAAESARVRGAPVAAAELLELAVRLGGDTPQRRISAAILRFEAGELARARVALADVIARLPPGTLRAEATCQLAVVRLFDDSFAEAAELLAPAIGEAGENLALRVWMSVARSFALVNSGRLTEALNSAEVAITDAEQLGQPHLLSQSLAMRLVLRFMRGDGIDELELQRALSLDDDRSGVPTAFRPRVQGALLRAWTGQLDVAHLELSAVAQHCAERGAESDLMFIAFHSVLIEIWRGNFEDAARIAEDTLERAQQLGGDLPLSVAMMVRSAVTVYAGRVEDGRQAVDEALAASSRCSSHRLAEWPRTCLGFLEVSLGDYQAALTTLEPLVATFAATPEATEIIAASYLPDAIEALIGLGRLVEAEPLIERLETNGTRLDRAWMLAVGARGRAMLLAARGDIDGASVTAQRAMAEHDRLPMPFERARTQLLLGQIQRRDRRKDDATNTLQRALATFETLGIPLWAGRARAELDRSNTGPRRSTMLTPSERRVADLAATGMTNRDVASTLFISPKTVEANLARVYRKLGIASRAELGSRMVRR